MGKNRVFVQIDYYLAGKSCKSYLEALADTSNRMGRKLTKFVDSSKGKLVGKEFDILRKRLETYASLFTYYNEIADVLSSNIVSSDNKVCNIMSSHKEVTDKNVDEIEEKIKNCSSLIYSTKNDLKNLEEDARKNEEKLLSQYNTTLTELKEEKKAMLDLIASIEAADNDGVSSIDNVMVKINTINSKMMY